VTGADPARNEVHVATVDGRSETVHYDHLIVTPGSVSRVLPVAGLAENGLGFKTLADAIALRNRALLNLEIAESLPDDEARREYLTFVFVGAGYAGLEGIAELQDYVADVIDRYPRCRIVGTRFVLVEARERVMPEIPASLAEFATRELRGRGMEIRTNTMLSSAEQDAVTLSTGERIPTRLLCWTAGVRPAPVVRELGLPIGPGGRIEVDATMRVAGSSNVWAIGDAAAVPDPAKRRQAPSPPTCQHAIRQGRRVAENVAATLSGGQPQPFRYRTLGVFVDMGQHKAVATILGVRLRGFPAWFAARTYHLAMMPGFARKVRLAADWTVGLVFGRASAELGQLGHPPVLSDAPEEAAQIR
jgi:NADH dehydrogenase